MSYYTKRKEKVRQQAINFQNYDGPISYYELAENQYKFEKLAKRYGLIKEFKENGII